MAGVVQFGTREAFSAKLSSGEATGAHLIVALRQGATNLVSILQTVGGSKFLQGDSHFCLSN